MSKDTGIKWTDHTFNIAWGCSKVSPGCQFCYAERDSKRYGFDVWGLDTERRTFGEKHWMEPYAWNNKAAAEMKKAKVFCSSMCDIYENHMTITQERIRLWGIIRNTPWLIWQLLTKRPERIKDCTPSDIFGRDNVWIGTSAENQEWWDRRVPVLLTVPDTKLFVSVEPMLGPVVAGKHAFDLDWVIIGGESGSHRRPCRSSWISNLVMECSKAGAAVFVKQDYGLKPGQQGSISDDIWAFKQFPKS